MKLIKSVLERNFTVTHKGKTYYISYLNSDGQILGLLNRDYWEVTDDEFYEIEDNKLKIKLIKFCIKHFDDYKPEINVYRQKKS